MSAIYIDGKRLDKANAIKANTPARRRAGVWIMLSQTGHYPAVWAMPHRQAALDR